MADTPTALALGMVNIVLGSVLFGWLFVRTRGSLLAHGSAHLDDPSRALPDHPIVFVAYTVDIGVVAPAPVLGDREAWKPALNR